MSARLRIAARIRDGLAAVLMAKGELTAAAAVRWTPAELLLMLPPSPRARRRSRQEVLVDPALVKLAEQVRARAEELRAAGKVWPDGTRA